MKLILIYEQFLLFINEKTFSITLLYNLIQLFRPVFRSTRSYSILYNIYITAAYSISQTVTKFDLYNILINFEI